MLASIQSYIPQRLGVRVKAFSPRPCDHVFVSQVNRYFSDLAGLSDSQITSRALDLRARVAEGKAITDGEIAVPGFALAKEAARRTLGMAHYDVQLLAGLALSSGAIAEMQTGEGKTLTSVLPTFLHALTGAGIHVATVNSYLAQRDFETLRPIYEMLGMSVAISADGAAVDVKRSVYECDITFATGYELGFDYLRDEVARRSQPQLGPGQSLRSGLRGTRPPHFSPVQRSHPIANIDEIDSVLIDEAITPLILSGPTGSGRVSSAVYVQAARVANQMQVGRDFTVNEEARNLRLTQTGMDSLFTEATWSPPGAQQLQSGSALMRPWSIYVEQALRAKHLFDKNVHYVVTADEVKIVDEYTGRIFDERSWQDGLHQAVEAKEGVTITDERTAIARVSRQRYFQLYKHLCGMSGTVSGHERELYNFYRLPVVVIPLRKPSARNHLPTLYFRQSEEKWDTITAEIANTHRSGQPVLVGTRTIANSQMLADRLSSIGLPFQLLNGLQDRDEAELVSQAGGAGTITIATNMAGRGTDIKLTDEAREKGGLHVIAAERHDSSRIDRQLIGRAARQGDPGSCRFFVAADDELVQRYDSAFSRKIGASSDSAGSSNPELDDAIRQFQCKAAEENFDQRARLMRQELWLNSTLNTVA